MSQGEARASLKDRCFICEQLDAAEFDYMCQVQYRADKYMKELFLSGGSAICISKRIASLTTPEAVSTMAILLIENGRVSMDGCLICEYLHAREDEYIGKFKNRLTGGSSQAFSASEKRLCQLHYKLLGNGLDGELLRRLAGIQEEHDERLLRELKGFIAKRGKKSARTADEETA
jgi:hypothetical protein